MGHKLIYGSINSGTKTKVTYFPTHATTKGLTIHIRIKMFLWVLMEVNKVKLKVSTNSVLYRWYKNYSHTCNTCESRPEYVKGK